MDRNQGRVTEVIRSLEKNHWQTLGYSSVPVLCSFSSFMKLYKYAKVIAQQKVKFLSPFFRDTGDNVGLTAVC